MESCTSKAALEIKRLRAKLEKTGHKPGSRNKPGNMERKVEGSVANIQRNCVNDLCAIFLNMSFFVGVEQDLKWW